MIIQAENKSSNSNNVFEAKDTTPLGSDDALANTSRILRFKIMNNKNEVLGHIKDIVLSLKNGKVHYVILSFGSFFGFREKLMAIPLDALKLNMEKKQFLLNMDKTRLDNPFIFDDDNWPDMTSGAWSSKVRKYFNLETPIGGSTL